MVIDSVIYRQLAILCECCTCLQTLFKKTSVECFQEFADLFVSLFMLADRRIQSDQPGSPEDLRVYTLEAAYSLIQSASSNVIREALHDELFRKALGHAISVSLAISTRESSKSLQITAVKVLQLWCQRSETLVMREESCRSRLSLLYRSFLPGISIAIMKLLTSDDKLPQALICTSLSVLSLTICLSLPSTRETIDGGDDSIGECGKNLTTVMQKISPELVKSGWISVRRSLFQLCKAIVQNCSSLVIESMLEVLLEILLTFCMEEDERLKNDAVDFVTSVLGSHSKQAIRVYESLEGKASECMESLMEQIEDCSPKEKVRKIQFLAGIFSTMHPRGCNLFMNIPSHRHHFIRFLILVCRLQQPESGFNRLNETSELKLHFFSSSEEGRGLQMIRSLLHFIASKVDQNIIEDILNDLNELFITQSEAIFAANQIIRELKGEILASHVDCCMQVLEHQCNSGQPLIGEALTRTLLAMEGVSICLTSPGATVLSQRSKDDILQMIYLLLNVLSYQDSQASSTCEKVLNLLSSQLHYPTVNDMIQDKLCYVTSRLQRDQQLMPASFNMAKLLQTILSFCSGKNITSYEQVVKASLQELDSCYSTNPTNILQALLVLLNFVSPKEALHQIECTGAEEREPFFALRDFQKKWQQFVSDIKAGDIDDADIIGERSEAEDAGERDQENEQDVSAAPSCPPPSSSSPSAVHLPPDAQMARMILEKCSNLLGTPESADQILVLEIISEAAVILKDYEDIFLPFVHKIWNQLVLRLSDEVAVARTAFHLLLVLSQVCGDFIERRTTTDVLPKITSFLRRHSQDGVRKETRIGHRFTITFKYQLECLQKIGPLTVGLNVQSKELWKLITVVLMYTSRSQPNELKEAAGQAIQFFRSQDPDSVWFYSQ